MSRSGAHEALHDHRIDMITRALKDPAFHSPEPIDVTVWIWPEQIELAGLRMIRVMPGLPPGAEVIDIAQFVDMPECDIEPPIAAGDPLADDAESAQWDDIQECWMDDDSWGCALRERALRELGRRS